MKFFTFKSIIFALLMFVCTSVYAQWPTLACRISNATKLQECGWYNIVDVQAGNTEVSTSYSDLAPAGHASQIVITHAVIRDWRAFGNGATTVAVLIVESPGGSSKWQVPLGWTADGYGYSRDAFSPGIIMAPGDELCLQTAGVAGQVSYSIQFTVLPERLR